MLATVPSFGATTGVSIFITSSTAIESPAFTASPTFTSMLNTFPAAPASTLMLPAPCGAAALAGAGAAALGAAAGAGADTAPPFSYYGNIVNISIYCDSIILHFISSCSLLIFFF